MQEMHIAEPTYCPPNRHLFLFFLVLWSKFQILVLWFPLEVSGINDSFTRQRRQSITCVKFPCQKNITEAPNTHEI